MATVPALKQFSDRVNRIEISATMAVVAEAARLKAGGADLVEFGAGEPHFHTPQHIKDAAAKADAAVSQAASDTGAKIDQVTADANKKMNEAADAVGQKVEKAGEKIQDAAHK